MNERSVVSFSLRKLSRDNSYSTYFNSRLITCLAYQASDLLAQTCLLSFTCPAFQYP